MEDIDKYVIKTFGIDHNTAATIIITLFIFLLSQLLVALVGIVKKTIEKRRYRINLLFIIEDFGKSCEKQYKTVIKSITTIDSAEDDNIVINTIALNSISYLNNLDLYTFTKNFTRILPTKNYSKSVSKLFSLLSQIKTLNESEEISFSRFMEAYLKYQDVYNDAIVKLREIRDELGMQHSGKKITTRELEYINHYINIYEQWMENGQNTRYKATYTEIIRRVIELNKQYGDVQLILIINQYVTQCHKGYINLMNIEKFAKKNFQHFAFKHRRASILIEKIILPNLKNGYIGYHINRLSNKRLTINREF